MMTTKRTLSVLSRIILSTVLITIFIIVFGILMFSGGSVTIVDLTENLAKLTLIFFGIFTAFYYTNEWFRTRNKIHKPFPYFLAVISIPILTSILLLPVINYVFGSATIFPSFKIILESNVLIIGTIALFFGLIHYLKYNIKIKNSYQNTIDWKSRKLLKKTIIYAVVLSFMYTLIINIVFTPSYLISIPITLIDFFKNALIAVICWYLICFLNKRFQKRMSLALLLLVTIIMVNILMVFVRLPLNFLIAISTWTDYNVLINSYMFSFAGLFLSNIPIYIYITFCVLFYQFLYFDTTQSKEREVFKAEIGKQTEKYENLRRQLSPHFLFNNINVLTALIEENPQKAVHFSESLGNIYRHFLRQEDEDIVSLQSALSFSEDYLELLKYRYEEAFQYMLPEVIEPNHYIVPLALQQVIENTIKHNEVSKEKPLQITMEIEDDYIIIQNTKQLKTTVENTKGTGIENIQKRYAFLTEQKVIVEDTKNTFTIKLPLLNMENS